MTQSTTVLQTERPPASQQSRGWGATLRRTLRKPQFWFGVTILVPTLIWYWYFAYQPIILAFRIAVVRYQILDPAGSPFVGLDNFRQLFNNPLFLISSATRSPGRFSPLSGCCRSPLASLSAW